MHAKTLLSISILMTFSPTVFSKPVSFLDETVVSATRTSQAKKEVSSSIATETRADMDLNLANDLKDALKFTPGVAATGGAVLVFLALIFAVQKVAA